MLSTRARLNNLLKSSMSRLHNYVKSFAEVSPWISLGLSLILLYVATYRLLAGWGYITSGRVTYYTKLFQGYEELLLVATLLPIYSAVASLGLSRLRVAVAVAYVSLAVLTYLIRPELLYIPYTVIVSALIITYRRKALQNIARGLAVAVALVELPALVYRVGTFLGLELSPLGQVHTFSTHLNSSLWYLPLIASAVVLTSPIASLRSRKTSDLGVGGGDEAYLALALLVALSVGLAGYSPAVNPRGVPIDVDWIQYYRWLNDMMSSANPVARAAELAGDRAAFLLILYVVAKLSRANLLNLCVYMEIVLLQLYTLASYYLAREHFGRRVARYVALLAPLTPHALSFIYGGFQADLFSLSLTYVALGLSARPNLRRLPLVLTISVLAVLTHAWTWLQFAALLATYVAISVVVGIVRRRGLRSYVALTPYVAYLAASFVAYAALRTHIRTKALELFEMNVRLFWTTLTTRIPSLDAFLRNSAFYYNIYTGGTLANYAYWPLVLVGSLTTHLHPLLYVVAFLPLALAQAMYSYTDHSSLLAYRITINLPTHLAVARLFEDIPREVRVALYISLLSLALGKVLSIVPAQ